MGSCMISADSLGRYLRGSWAAVATCLVALALAGCGSVASQIDGKMSHKDISLTADALASGGVGFLTPSAATGREADKQALALAFATRLERGRGDIRVVHLPSILSAVNAAQLDQDYKQMYRDYLETGILDGELLKRIGEIGQVRYLAQLNLASFEQQSRGRFSIVGLRIVETKQANMRLFLQIWDSANGAVAWEGGGELNYAYETLAERPVTFDAVAAAAADRIYAGLPQSVPAP